MKGLFGHIVGLGRSNSFVGAMFSRLFIPSILFSTGWALSDIADAVVVGQSLGTTGLAGIALVLPVYMINCTLAHGLGLGGSVRFSQLMAHGDFAAARACFVETICFALVVSGATAVLGLGGMDMLLRILGASRASGEVLAATREYLTVLVASTPLFYLSNILNYYLYNDDSQRLAVLGAIIGNISDIAFNFTLVLGFGLGMRGAALSTTIGQLIAISVFLIGLKGREHHLRLGCPRKGWFVAGFGQLRKGLASSVSYLCQMVFFIVCNNLLVRLGGDVAVAVFDVLQNASYVLLYLFEGTSRAMQPLLSTFFSENGRDDLAETRARAWLLGGGIGLALVLLVEIAPSCVCGMFGVGAGEVRELTEFALRIYCVGAVFAGLNILESGYSFACGVPKASLVIQTLRGIAILLPLTVVFGFVGNLRTFWFVFPLTEIATWCVFRLLVRFRRDFGVELLSAERIFRRAVSGTTQEVMTADREIETFCESRGIDPRRCYAVTLAVEEICAVIVRKGMRNGRIQITLLDHPEGDVILMMRYNDDFFNPFSLQTGEANEAGDFDMDAMGILMIRKQAKDFAYRRYQGFNSLVVRL